MYTHSGLGQPGMFSAPAPQDDPAKLMGPQGEMTAAAKPAAGAAATGSSAGEIMQGIGAILTPLVQAGVGIYAAEQQAKQRKEMEKAQLRYASQPVYIPPPPPQKSPALMIILVLVGLGIVGAVMFMMTRGGSAAPAAAAPASTGGIFVSAAPAAPRIRRVRRVRKKPKRRKR